MAKHAQFTVQGKPFLSLGGQTHNSSSYFPDDMERSFQSVKALGGNTVATPVCWDKFEPEEGRFDERYVTSIIDRAREWEMRLVFLWFATWKNGTMGYAPPWVKKDAARFPRTLCKDGTPTFVLSCHSEENRAADERAFRRLMRVIRDYDEAQNTVIAVQVQNEPGILGPTRRDFGPEGERDFAIPVPAELIAYAKAHPGGRLDGFWKAAGSLEGGTWTEVFGRYGAEAFTAWHIARYIDSIAAAGKEEYDLFLYANVWLDGGIKGAGFDIGGLEYPCGGAVSKSVEVWYAACTALDCIAPDIYQTETTRHIEAQEAYSFPKDGWPLYVPESAAAGLNSSLMFHAVGALGAIGYHIFGCESCLTNEGELRDGAQIMRRSMTMLSNVSNLILRHREDGRMHAMVQKVGEGAATLNLDGWKCRVNFMGPSLRTDFRLSDEAAKYRLMPTDVAGETARGLLFQVSEYEFYLVGHGLCLYFNRPEAQDGSLSPMLLSPMHQSMGIETLILEEGRFADGSFVPERVRSGDEACGGIWAMADCGVIHFVLNAV